MNLCERNPINLIIIPIEKLQEHPANRTRFDSARLEELAASIREKGVLNPLLVRPLGKDFQVLAGARRLRAAKEAGLKAVPAIVRELDDREALELLVVDNLQREDVHPLEEAVGYRLLHEDHKIPIEQLAAKLGKSTKYVYDRLKLCALREEAQKDFLEGRFEAGHAILLARLKPEDQKRAMEEGLYEREQLLFDPTDDRVSTEQEKARTVRELDAWIAAHVRFDVAKVDQMVFPETAAAVSEAETSDGKVLPITYDHWVRPEARDGKTLCCLSWKRADGKEKSKTCEHAELGVVVTGWGQGQAFAVCRRKEKCKIHWGAEMRAKARRAATSAKSPGKTHRESWHIEAEKQRQKDVLREAADARWKKAFPAIHEALAERVRKMPVKPDGLLARTILDQILEFGKTAKAAAQLVPPGKTAEDLVRHFAFVALHQSLSYSFRVSETGPKLLKAFGLDAKKILAEYAPVEKPETSAGKKTRKKSKGPDLGGGEPVAVAAGVCRVCGCTEEDCSECVEETGETCSWADEAETLCSRCADGEGERNGAAGAKAKPAKKKPAKARKG